jgi:hypothetical protein
MIIASSELLEEAIFFATRKRLKEVSQGYPVMEPFCTPFPYLSLLFFPLLQLFMMGTNHGTPSCSAPVDSDQATGNDYSMRSECRRIRSRI